MNESLARDEFLKALRGIPNDEKEGYLQALAKNLDLLYYETIVDHFLEIDKSSPSKSARRFVDYWNHRMATFGEDAFLPLQLWNGSMHGQTCNLIRSSWVMILPHDEAGRPVVFLNCSYRDCLSVDQVSLADRERCVFYVLQILCRQAEARSKGCTFIFLVHSSFHEANSLILWLDRIVSSFPLHVSKIHVLPIGDLGDQEDFFDRFIPYALKLLMSSKGKGFCPENCLHVHEECPVLSFSAALARHGIGRDGIPTTIGGFWSQQHQLAMIDRWTESEIRYASMKRSETQDFSFPARTETAEGEQYKEEDISSKMKKQRRRCQDAAVIVRHAYLQEKNQKLRASVAMLETLLMEAQRFLLGV
jgi:hypothetical protein